MSKQAEHLFTQFCSGYENRDLSLLLSLFTQEAIMWGSAIDEYRVGLAQIEAQLQRDWQQSDHGQIKVGAFIPTKEDEPWTAAINTAKLVIAGEEYEFEQLRGTITIAQEEGQWKIAHMHASFPDYRNSENSSFPVGA
ncbi:MAG: hypothetical protein EPN84_03300 [Legionella sp.]|nr:MAG: hypothetical protein EPN84_03300 [Legionella sp.]